jgi:hypothetical protein
MKDVINLNRARKARARQAERAAAAENRIKFGRTKAEKSADRNANVRARKTLDDARRDS